MQFRNFTPLNENLSVIGLGTVKIGRNKNVKNKSGDGFSLPDDKALHTLLDVAIDCGINVLDTAPAYGNSEERLGSLLGTRRKKFFLITKVGEEFDGDVSSYDFSKPHVEMSIARSLKRLRTDYLDSVLVHCNRSDLKNLQESDIFSVLMNFKEKGLIRSFGASTYSKEASEFTLKHSDCIMLTLNPKDLTNLNLIGMAHALQKPVFVKKALCQGYVSDTANTPTLRECLQLGVGTKGVCSLVLGTLNPLHLAENCKLLDSI